MGRDLHDYSPNLNCSLVCNTITITCSVSNAITIRVIFYIIFLSQNYSSHNVDVTVLTDPYIYIFYNNDWLGLSYQNYWIIVGLKCNF
jgi:hypothetical protein